MNLINLKSIERQQVYHFITLSDIRTYTKYINSLDKDFIIKQIGNLTTKKLTAYVEKNLFAPNNYVIRYFSTLVYIKLIRKFDELTDLIEIVSKYEYEKIPFRLMNEINKFRIQYERYVFPFDFETLLKGYCKPNSDNLDLLVEDLGTAFEKVTKNVTNKFIEEAYIPIEEINKNISLAKQNQFKESEDKEYYSKFEYYEMKDDLEYTISLLKDEIKELKKQNKALKNQIIILEHK